MAPTDAPLFFSYATGLWHRALPDGTVSVGLTRHLLTLLGAPEFVRLPPPGTPLSRCVPFGCVETQKTAFDLSLPFDAVLETRNEDVLEDPAGLDGAADGSLPLLTIRPAAGNWSAGLLDETAFRSLTAP